MTTLNVGLLRSLVGAGLLSSGATAQKSVSWACKDTPVERLPPATKLWEVPPQASVFRTILIINWTGPNIHHLEDKPLATSGSGFLDWVSPNGNFYLGMWAVPSLWAGPKIASEEESKLNNSISVSLLPDCGGHMSSHLWLLLSHPPAMTDCTSEL